MYVSTSRASWFVDCLIINYLNPPLNELSSLFRSNSPSWVVGYIKQWCVFADIFFRYNILHMMFCKNGDLLIKQCRLLSFDRNFFQFEFSVTWSCASLTRSTASSDWKFLRFVNVWPSFFFEFYSYGTYVFQNIDFGVVMNRVNTFTLYEFGHTSIFHSP